MLVREEALENMEPIFVTLLVSHNESAERSVKAVLYSKAYEEFGFI